MARKAILEGGKRDEIIAAATKLFFTEGFEATSVRKILALVDGEIDVEVKQRPRYIIEKEV